MQAFAVKHADDKIVEQSRSGGFFTAISDYILENEGCVYGCVLTEDMSAKHIRATTKAGRDKMRGSKYIQSNLGNIFLDVKKDLENGMLVLFSGTSCQVAGLKNFLGKDYDNLVTINILCSGVPSEKIWQDYLEYMRPHGYTIRYADFRNKQKYGWQEHIETLIYENKRGGQISIDSYLFKELFSKHLIIRPACYKCPFKSFDHPADITIGDFWGIESSNSEFNDDKGCSLVLLNNNKAEKLFFAVSNLLHYKACAIDECVQPVLIKPFDLPEDREAFWECYSKRGIGETLHRYAGFDTKKKVKLLLKTVINNISLKIGRK